MKNAVCVGSAAPEVALGDSASPPPLPRVLAFVRGWSPSRVRPADLLAMRAELRGLGADLFVIAEAAAWSIRPDDAIESCGTIADRARLAESYGVSPGRDAIFVIDERAEVRFVHRSVAPLAASLPAALTAAGEAMLARHSSVLFTRREWNVTALVTGFALVLLGACRDRGPRGEKPEAPRPQPAAIPELAITLHINGKERALRVDPRASLLDALREQLELTGTKKGCDMGQCGACTVLADGQRVLSCLTLAAMAQGRKVVTIEGLANGDALHPMQQAFIEHDGLQCGYCTPGQILSAVALLAEGRATTDAEVREQMSGNLCRCGAYPNIVAAIQSARRRGA